MNSQEPIDPREEAELRKWLGEAQAIRSIRERMKLHSARFLGLPYIVHPLIGSMTEPEQLMVRFDGFDCVTYVETVLAMSLARNRDEFLKDLREIRYDNGKVEWQRRLHYTSDWIAVNIRRGLLRDMTDGPETSLSSKNLSLIPGLPPRSVQLRYFPKTQFTYLSRWMTDGDIISFLSTRRNLDFFHMGLIFRDGDRILIRHARQMRKRVFEQLLPEFIRAVQSPGFTICRLMKD